MKKNIRKGFTLVELWLTISVSCLALITFLSLGNHINRTQVNKTIAEQMEYYGQASKRYMIAYQAGLLDWTSGGAVVAIWFGKNYSDGTNSPGYDNGMVSDMQQGDSYMSDAYIIRNYYQQYAVLLIRSDGYGNLNGIVVTYYGNNMSDRDMGEIVNMMGPAGGMVPNTPLSGQTGNMIYGYNGTWESSISNWGSVVTPATGHIAYKVDLMGANGNNPDSYLAKSLVGHDTIQDAGYQMHADLNMNGNDISGVSNTTLSTINNLNYETIRVADYAMGQIDPSEAKTNVIVNGNLMTQATPGVALSNLPYFNNGIKSWDMYSEGTIYVAHDDTLSAYMNGWSGKVAATNFIKAPILRPEFRANVGDSCGGSVGTYNYANSNPDTSKLSVNVGDMASDPNGLTISCQNTSSGQKWEPAFQSYTHLVNASCPAPSSSYMNNSGKPEFVTVITKNSGSGDESSRSLSLSIEGNQIWYQDEDSKTVNIIATGHMKQAKQFTGYAFVPPGKTLTINASSGIQNMCVFE